MQNINNDGIFRCFGNKPGQQKLANYHDNEWGIPVFDDKILFEYLVLEGAQAGLSWITVLQKREFYRQAFYNFDVKKIVNMSNEQLDDLKINSNIIRNTLKIHSVKNNADIFIKIQEEFDSFSKYLWSFVNNNPIDHNKYISIADVPTISKESDKLSKDLKLRGMKFVGPTIMYAYMQAIGMVNNHLIDCWKHKK